MSKLSRLLANAVHTGGVLLSVARLSACVHAPCSAAGGALTAHALWLQVQDILTMQHMASSDSVPGTGTADPLLKAEQQRDGAAGYGTGMIPATVADPRKDDPHLQGGMMPNGMTTTPLPIQENNGGMMPSIAPAPHVGPGGNAVTRAENVAAATEAAEVKEA